MKQERHIREEICTYSSVLSLATRSSIYKVLLLLLGMTVAEGIAFRRALQEELERFITYAGEQWYEWPPVTLGEILAEGIFARIFMCSMLLLAAVLVWTECERGKSKSRMLLWRLRISPHRSFCLWAIYNMICYVVLIAVQCILVLVFYQVYLRELQMLIPYDMLTAKAPQELFLAFHTNAFLHGILPLNDFWLSCRLVLAIVAWGMAAAYIGYIGYAGHNQRSALLIMFLGYSIMFTAMGVNIGWVNLLVILSAVICIVSIGISVKGGWGYELGET